MTVCRQIWMLFRKISTHRALNAEKESLMKCIQDDTKTTLRCSKTKINGTIKRSVEIRGSTQSNVDAARQRIKTIGGGNDNSQPTHFTCIRITDNSIKLNYSKFKEEISKFDKTTETHKRSFMKPEKLHITFGVMRLNDDESRSKAQHILTDCVEKMIRPIKDKYGKVEFTAQGLELMKGKPTKAKVVYAQIESESLQQIANAITKSFVESGLGKRESNEDAVKLHMTVMNVKYVRPKRVNSFDAAHIFDQFKDFNFGHQIVEQILLVDMKERDADGFYKCVASVDL
ncbi:uncharacterized protein LOC119069812 isoform X2 [Bradysia coprophila]|uniref:uncharacterized protein LOC119069812 isoform X2 n=1 Tax=Bradysia coprophila TaxID=38358 RepID=UPI00187D7434|nr:uncharacterized protein LOC119069812 isoform X2 [Bradysia coprophila]